MDTPLQELQENRKYNLSLRDGNVKDCIYEGVCGNGHCFTTKQTENDWEYYFLAEGDFRASGSTIEVLINQPKTTIISRETEPVEFLQIQAAWERVLMDD